MNKPSGPLVAETFGPDTLFARNQPMIGGDWLTETSLGSRSISIHRPARRRPSSMSVARRKSTSLSAPRSRAGRHGAR